LYTGNPFTNINHEDKWDVLFTNIIHVDGWNVLFTNIKQVDIAGGKDDKECDTDFDM
jgi:hypothetical protein